MSRPRIAIPLDANVSGRYEQPRSYADAVARAGGLPLPIPFADPSLAGEYLAACDGLLVAGGDFDIPPERYGEPRRPGCGPSRPGRTAFEKFSSAAPPTVITTAPPSNNPPIQCFMSRVFRRSPAPQRHFSTRARCSMHPLPPLFLNYSHPPAVLPWFCLSSFRIHHSLFFPWPVASPRFSIPRASRCTCKATNARPR